MKRKVLIQGRYLSTRLNYANKKSRETWLIMINITNSSTEDMIDKLQEIEGKTNFKIYRNISKYNDEMNYNRQSGAFHFEEDAFSKNAPGFSKIYHEVLLLKNFLQTKPQVKSMDNILYDIDYTVIENNVEKEIMNVEYENNENDYNIYNDYIITNHFVGRKNDNTLTTQRKMRYKINHLKLFILYKQRRKM